MPHLILLNRSIDKIEEVRKHKDRKVIKIPIRDKNEMVPGIITLIGLNEYVGPLATLTMFSLKNIMLISVKKKAINGTKMKVVRILKTQLRFLNKNPLRNKLMSTTTKTCQKSDLNN